MGCCADEKQLDNRRRHNSRRGSPPRDIIHQTSDKNSLKDALLHTYATTVKPFRALSQSADVGSGLGTGLAGMT